MTACREKLCSNNMIIMYRKRQCHHFKLLTKFCVNNIIIMYRKRPWNTYSPQQSQHSGSGSTTSSISSSCPVHQFIDLQADRKRNSIPEKRPILLMKQCINHIQQWIRAIYYIPFRQFFMNSSMLQ